MSEPHFFLDIAKSATGKSWVSRLDNRALANALAMEQKLGLPAPLARVLSGRDVEMDEAERFLAPSIKELMPDPLQLNDMAKASQRIIEAIEKQQYVAIFADYDVDGACSAAIIARFLNFFGVKNKIYIPDRIKEGYGPNSAAMVKLVEEGAQLIITVDCGANSGEAIKAARQAGADIVVLDHHQMDDIHQEAVALVNPNRPDDLSGCGYLCAGGVCFMTVAQIMRDLKQRAPTLARPDILAYLDLVALSTICDVVPLVGFNRALVNKGLQVARRLHNKGLSALTASARIGEPLNVFHFGYILGPRINAGGRIGDPALGARLLTLDDGDEAARIAEQLNSLNEERQRLTKEQLLYAESHLLTQWQDGSPPAAIVVYGEDWHPGIVGILAARLKERYNRPAIVLALKEDGLATGSARSIPGVDMGAMVRQAASLSLVEKGGGHAMAAGLSVAVDKIEALRQWLCDHCLDSVHQAQLRSDLYIDGALSANSANLPLYHALEQAGPYGAGNPSPVFVFPSHHIADMREVGQGHLIFTIKSLDGSKMKAICFNAVDSELGQFLTKNQHRPLHIAGNLMLNYWRGSANTQLRVIDAALAG